MNQTLISNPLFLRKRSAGLWVKEHIFILNYLGALLTVTGLLLTLALIPYEWYQEGTRSGVPVSTFALPAALSILVGLFAQKGISTRAPTVRDAMIITGLGWVVISLVSAVPFMIGLHQSFINAFFESVSGLTTTGITVFEGLDAMPKSILLWRSFIQWIGGLGILTFFLAVGFRGGSAAASLFGAEGHKISTSRPVPGIFNTVKILWGIYIGFTVVSFFCYLFGGMSGFDALNHCLTSISTGGFSTHDASIAYYAGEHYAHARFIEYAASFFMLAGGINFLVHYQVFTGDIQALYKNFEMRWFWTLTLGAAGLILMDHFRHFPLTGNPLHQMEGAFRASLFQTASMISSTGYASLDINDAFFPALSKQIFLILMVVGGCVGSTAGGLKVLRIGILSRMFKTQLARIAGPSRAVSPIVVAGKTIPNSEIQRIAALACAWMILIAVGAGITASFSDLDAWQSLSGMASAVGNMGPFYFSVHKMASLSGVIKFTYIVGMLAGRLEILPIAVLFYRSTWR